MEKMKNEDIGVPYIFIRHEIINYRQTLVEQLNKSTLITMCTTGFAIKKLCISHDSHIKQKLFPCVALINLSL
jgi:hypothetical protein